VACRSKFLLTGFYRSLTLANPFGAHRSRDRKGAAVLKFAPRQAARLLTPGIGIASFALFLALSFPAAADVAAGRAIFEGKGACLTCHAIGERGGSLGPELSKIGVTRSPESLRLALVNPDAEIEKEYFTVVAVTNLGLTVRGITLNEDDLSIQIRDSDGNLRSFLKDELKNVSREPRSLMPSYAGRLSAAEIDDVIVYLRTLRGPAPKLDPRTRQPHRAYSSIAFLDRIGRDAEERPDTLINALEIPAGAIVAEIGSGTGYYTWRLARTVGPSGKVFAVDIQQSMLDRTAETVRKHQTGNVELVLGDEETPRLPVGALDLVFIAHAYHEFSNPEAIMAAVNRSLKPGGRLATVEFAEGHPFGPQDKADRMTKEQIRAEIEPAGFDLDRVLDIVRIEHCLVFTKREEK
jgi:putative heme-binding domain-containing protein